MPQAHNSFGLQADRVPYLYVRLLEKAKLNSRLKCSKSLGLGCLGRVLLGPTGLDWLGFLRVLLGINRFRLV